ncbi:hypothetical protein [Acidisoma silvae]|uniref:Uncharacterized protein n=1 Tax=Acidisoma silvae TaxID=2802396 RepID=A0A963YWQ7_9PROT|nr:hypothetical protein [Acidisoma silvae]MCB8878259.1 hypothetical protein [Acidisoma silvae]
MTVRNPRRGRQKAESAAVTAGPAAMSREGPLEADARHSVAILPKIVTQQNLDRAVRLAQMAAVGQGPLVLVFAGLGATHGELADSWPQTKQTKSIEGGAG